MSYSIFIANPTALIAQPGRTVNTFPSGLVRVDQTYLGLTNQSATHRATFAVGNNMPDGDASPSIDGLKIYPGAQEIRRENGITEYKVSAYGRTKLTGKVDSNFEDGFVQVYSQVILNGQMTNSEYKISCLNEVLYFQKVVSQEEFPNKTLPAGAVIRVWVPSATNPNNYVLLQDAYPPGPIVEPTSGSQISTTHSITIIAELVDNSSTLYGEWKEQSLKMRAAATMHKGVIYS